MEITLPHNEGWNLVGLPLDTTPFPCDGYIDGSLYSFETGSYLNISTNEMAIGSGYWLRFEEADECTFSGVPIDNITVSLNEGWNLISGISTSVAVNTIIDLNELIVPGTIYGFGGSYVETEFLDPGYGYWLRSTGEGEVTLSSSALLNKSRTFQLPDHLNTLTLNNIALYFGGEIFKVNKLSYSLPPKPPAPSTDVRFYGDTKLCSSDECVIEVLNDGNPLTFEFDIKDGEDWELVPVITNETKWSAVIPLADKNQITLDSEVNQWILRKSTPTVPNTFTLHPAYPNPFNPITSLHYDLPEQAQVTLTIYDLMGREVVRLVHATQEAGYRSVQWNATDGFGKPVSAGVYLYQIRASDYVQTKKMVLLK